MFLRILTHPTLTFPLLNPPMAAPRTLQMIEESDFEALISQYEEEVTVYSDPRPAQEALPAKHYDSLRESPLFRSTERQRTEGNPARTAGGPGGNGSEEMGRGGV